MQRASGSHWLFDEPQKILRTTNSLHFRSNNPAGQEESRHLRDVLRLGPGDEIYVFDGEGSEYQCVIGEARAIRPSFVWLLKPHPQA